MSLPPTHHRHSPQTTCIGLTLGMGNGGVSMKFEHDANICKNIKWYLFRDKEREREREAQKKNLCFHQCWDADEQQQEIELYLKSNLRFRIVTK